MFTALRRLADSILIALSYPAFEASARRAHAAKAESMYSTAEVESIREEEISKISKEAKQKFGARIRLLRSGLADASGVLEDARDKLVYFRRDYGNELNQSYDLLNAERKSRTECSEQLTQAHADLASAKRSLDSWYAKAEGNWFGNAGKQLPKNSFFGQDLADRDRYKSNRDRAARGVDDLHRHRDSIDRRIKDVEGTIASIKGARQKMFDLKTQGFEQDFLLGVVEKASKRRLALEAAIERVQSRNAAFIEEEHSRRRIPELDDRISKLMSGKQEYKSSFDSPSARAERKATHIREWKAKHSR